MWMIHDRQHGARDILSGLVMDMSCPPHAPRKPTLCAHRSHHVPFDFGMKKPFPEHLEDYDHAQVNARVELWRTNTLVSSWPVDALETFLDSCSESRL